MFNPGYGPSIFLKIKLLNLYIIIIIIIIIVFEPEFSLYVQNVKEANCSVLRVYS